MAKQQKLTAQPRIKTGRSAVNEIKKQGLVPAVVYGGKDKPINLSINAREIGNIVLPRAVRRTLLYRLMVENTLQFLIEEVGEVDGIYESNEPLVERFAMRRAASAVFSTTASGPSLSAILVSEL